MKQHITKKQWDELSDVQKHKMVLLIDKYDLKWSSNNNDTQVPLLTIGQMIEFLGDAWWDKIESRYYNDNPFILCDALWEAVKYKLKK